MPPVPRRIKFKGKKETKASFERRKRRYAVRNYNKQNRNAAMSSNRIIPIRTLLPKEQVYSIPYRETLDFTFMGSGPAQGGVNCPCVIKISMNDCIMGNNSTPVAPFHIVDVMNIGGGTTPPVFTRSHQLGTLKDQLDPLFDKYRRCVVERSSVKVRVSPKINLGGYLGPQFTNVNAVGTNTEGSDWDTNHPAHLGWSPDPARNGHLYVWGVKQKSTGQLIDIANANTPSLHELKENVPGLVMKQVKAYSNGTTSADALLSAGYSPHNFGIKDWRDNIKTLKQVKSLSAIDNDKKRMFYYVGVQGAKPVLQTGNSELHPVRVEVFVQYKVRFIDRSNDPDGGDEALPEPRDEL